MGRSRFLSLFWLVASACTSSSTTPTRAPGPASPSAEPSNSPPVVAVAQPPGSASPVEPTPAPPLDRPSQEPVAPPPSASAVSSPPSKPAVVTPARRTACLRTCETNFQATNAELSERLNAQMQNCSSSGDNESAECMQLVQTTLEQASADAKAFRQACQKSCKETGEPL